MAEDPIIQITNWEDHQHYKKRDPPWIKLYSRMLDDDDLMQLPERTRFLAVGLLLLASRTQNAIKARPSYLRNRLWTDCVCDVEKLASIGFITLSQDASTLLATCHSQQRRGEERRGETSSTDVRVREPSGMDALRNLLGDYAPTAEDVTSTVTGSTTWPQAVVGLYGPSGTRREVFSGVPEPERPRLLAAALQSFAGEQTKWNQPFFDRILERQVREYSSGQVNGAPAGSLVPTDEEKRQWYGEP